METRSILWPAASAPQDPRARARAWWAIAVAMISSAPTLRSASAGPILTYSDVTIAVKSGGGFLGSEDTKVFPPGNPGIVSVLSQPRGWGRFPTSQSLLPGGYHSATLTTTGFAGLGVSGFMLNGDPNPFAKATLEQSVTNTGDAATGLVVTYTIPALEASILAGPSVEPGRSFFASAVDATFKTFKYLADGTLLEAKTVFDFGVFIQRIGAGTTNVVIDRSADLEAKAGVGNAFINGDVAGVKYDGFSGERNLASLEPGERLVIRYELIAQAVNELRIDEVGFQALIGDPFQTSGTGGLQISPSAVPEPSSLVLLGLGIVGLLAYARCQII